MMTDFTPTPKRPYIVRAFHEWLTDNNYTPYLMADINKDNVIAPIEYANEGRLVLAISYQATKDLLIDNDGISFSARFGGVSKNVYIPMPAVMGIYAKEATEHGVFFDPHEYDNYTPNPQDGNDDNDDDDDDNPPPSHLKFV